MPLLNATLKVGLVALASDHPADEAAAIVAWGDALGTYWTGATANGIPIVPAFVALGVTAAKGAMGGLTTTGFVAIQAGVIAGWAAMTLSGAFGANVAALAPTGITGLAAALQAAGDLNVSSEASIDAACQALADAWQPLSIIGGTATFPGPAVFPIV